MALLFVLSMLTDQHTGPVVVRAPAKLNLFLEVLKKRPDGYHEILTLMVAVNLFDTLEFKEEPKSDIVLTCDEPALSVGRDNLVWRAAELLRQRAGVTRGVHIRLTKGIPMEAGLGGGSSDAAATLNGLNQLWELNLPLNELADLAATLGSDAAFFLMGPAAWCAGRGEQVTPCPLPQGPLHFVVACPVVGLSTAAVYRAMTVPETPVSAEPLREALANARIEEVGRVLFNRLQPPAEKLCPAVAELRELFAGLNVLGHAMSGSGSSYFALCRTPAEADATARKVRQQYRGTRIGPDGRQFKVFVVDSLENSLRNP